MKYFRSIIHFAKPYMGYAWLNIIANIFYALFGTLAFVSLMPMLKVLFQNAEKVTTKPVYQGLGNIGQYSEDLMNFFITQQIETEGTATVPPSPPSRVAPVNPWHGIATLTAST